ncbi:MAG: hypothetical protein QNL62_01725 [Gammaproteobacteria bacterium]|nr:hypothetical protein [Gammaproteobacteria bacterium]
MFSLTFNNQLKEKIQHLLYGDLSHVWMKLEKHSINSLNNRLVADFIKKIKSEKISSKDELILVKRLITMLQIFISEENNAIRLLQLKYAEYTKRYKRSTSESDKKKHILEFSKEMGATSRQLDADKKALRLWLDHDAITDRFYYTISHKEKQLTFSLTRLARLITENINIMGKQSFSLQEWQKLDLESILTPLFNYKGDERVRMTAFKVMMQCVKSLDKDIQQPAFSENILRYIYRSALDYHQDIWIQTEALELLSTLSPENFRLVFLQRFNKSYTADDIFIKHYAALLLEKYYAGCEFDPELVDIVIKDESPYVRQAIGHIMSCFPVSISIDIYKFMFFSDPSPQVRGALLLSMCPSVKINYQQSEWLPIIVKLLENEKDPFVLRILLEQIPQMIKTLAADQALQKKWVETIFPVLGTLHQTADKIKVRRWAARSREWIWCFCSNERINLLEKLQADSLKLYDKDIISTLKNSSLKNIDGKNLEDEIARLLSLIAQNHDGFDLQARKKSFKLYKKPFFVFRWWRVLYEFKHSSIDKRQAYPHTIGRLSRGRIYIPSTINAELSMTKVPGEPFYFEDEDGWRPFLPLVDDIISLLDPLFIARPIKIVTPDGITRITPPANPFKRIIALSVVTLKFDYFARLRNWEEVMQNQPHHYIRSLEKLGLKFEFAHHHYSFEQAVETESSVKRFFGTAVPLPFTDFFSSFKDYFYSVYENNLNELLIFLSIVSAYFIGRHIFVNRMIKKSRTSMGIVIGGWGTRGKSGTERLKAALFNALGFNIVSKTTGCEAMFLHSYAYGKLREMFLFRPYDKATIWEQGNILRLAHKMDTDVFLWECMGLTPSYVEILQRQWMQDDIATITNTYPDHEDIQGPAGHNIPEVMTRFIPQNSVLITSEEQMLPTLRKEAAQQNTRFVSVGWKEAGLITDDVLKRFPYDEHPYNIALVLSMAREFGISEVYALKEMADRVVPDLGVLKTYPTASVQSRKLTFVMGMSANERYGALGNWKRMGFDKLSLEKNPDIWVSALINNRADRIPRSRVFADYLVNDVSVDSIYLIGTNLHGFMGYLKESWLQQQENHTLDVANKTSQQVLRDFAKRFRIPVHEKVILQRLSAMLSGLGEEKLLSELYILWSDMQQLRSRLQSLQFGNNVLTVLDNDLELLSAYQLIEQKVAQKLDTDIPAKQLDKELDELLWQCFSKRIVIIEDEHATGDDIINTIVNCTPPGLENKIMGMQNIKGTGLDFVYRWLSWGFCYSALEQLSNDKAEIAQNGLKQLVTFQEYSVLCEQKLIKTIHIVKQKAWAQRESVQAELELIELRMQNTLDSIKASMGKQDISSRWKIVIINFFEELLDTGDAIKRRKKADLIYKELIHQRISHARAAVELKKLNTRQKGGWLSKKILK